MVLSFHVDIGIPFRANDLGVTSGLRRTLMETKNRMDVQQHEGMLPRVGSGSGGRQGNTPTGPVPVVIIGLGIAEVVTNTSTSAGCREHTHQCKLPGSAK